LRLDPELKDVINLLAQSSQSLCNGFHHLPHILPFDDLQVAEPDPEMLFNSNNKIGMGHGIPLFNIIRGRFRIYLDIIIVENTAENQIQFFVNIHDRYFLFLQKTYVNFKFYVILSRLCTDLAGVEGPNPKSP
jgi:hypothetical protein